MEFIFNCPHCDRQLAADEQSRGQSVVCPACLQSLTIPVPAPGFAGMAGQDEVVEVVEEFRPPAPGFAGMAGQDEVVEVVEEFRPPASPAPPLAHGEETTALPPTFAPGVGGRRPAMPFEGVPPTRAAYERRADWMRHRTYDGLLRRTQLVAAVVAIVFCSLLAMIIYLVGRPPGEGLVSFNWFKSEPAGQTNASVQLEVARLTGVEQKELLQLTVQSFQNLSPDEGQAAKMIYTKITQKQPTTTEQRQYFNALFQKGVLKMPPAEQERLRSLFAKTVVATP